MLGLLFLLVYWLAVEKPGHVGKQFLVLSGKSAPLISRYLVENTFPSAHNYADEHFYCHEVCYDFPHLYVQELKRNAHTTCRLASLADLVLGLLLILVYWLAVQFIKNRNGATIFHVRTVKYLFRETIRDIMAKKLLTKMQMSLGRLMGQTSRKEKNVVDAWTELCTRLKQKTTDRLLELIKFDLNNNGVDLTQLRQIERSEEVSKAFNDVDLALQISQMAKTFTQATINRELETQKTIEAMQRQHQQQLGLIRTMRQQQEEQVKTPPTGKRVRV